ncbi:MAG: type IV pilus biogenesis/stability protein PilW [Woeseiaceae bacterium]|nr:type IV pilus biogenesis/stability protein PilW [Woeseiaceae bacterium]NNL63729.1 type IV pilus biogenesis/stability protein PilW [Woeseiaceae bacterium]
MTLAGCISSTTGTPTREADETDAAEVNYQLGQQYFQNEHYELALDRLQRAIDLDPRSAKSHLMLGMTYDALQNERLARQYYDEAIRIAPRDFNMQNAYAVFLCKKRAYTEAERYFQRASQHPENDDAERTLTNGGLCMLQKPDKVAAEKLFRAALEHRSDYGEALLQLCLLKYGDKDYLGARAFLARYMVANPSTAGVLYLAADIEGKLDNDRGRMEFVNQLLRDFPESPEARKVLSSG